jgi:subtilisin family serine protease
LLSKLNEESKEKYRLALKERITSLETLIETLKSEGETDFAELLNKSISYINEDSVYCGEGNIVIVNWGLIPRNGGSENGIIYRSGKFFGIWNTLQSPIICEPVQITSHEKETTPITNSILVKPALTEAIPTTDSVLVKPTFIDESQQESVADIPFSEETKIEDLIENIQTNKEEKCVEPPVTPHCSKAIPEDKQTNRNEYSWTLFFRNFLNGVRFIWKKIWWILLLLLLLLVLMFLGKDYQGAVSQWNPFYNALPKHPVVLPIDKDCVGTSDDGLVKIATDRLNILLEKENGNTMQDWAHAFKKAYPSAGYSIFYYNEDLYNLQIKVPKDKREQVKKEINEKISGFTFEVFDEPVYDTEGSFFNDPELKNTEHSWYLTAIGAYDAWNLTQGSPNVTVAVIDNGFDLTHPELVGKISSPYNVLTQNSTIRPIITKDGEDVHGTHVAATAVGKCNNNSGLVGIAPKCKLMPIQVCNDNPEGLMSNLAIMEGVMYAIQHRADVINLSLGVGVSKTVASMTEGQQLNYISCSQKEIETMWNRIYERAKKSNSIIVFSAGNENVISGVDPKKRNKSTVIVSAVNTQLDKASFSNYGRYKRLGREYSSVSAPGVDIYSAAPHGKYVVLEGTSMSAPIVSGTIALMKSIEKDITANEAIRILKSTGKEVNPKIGPLINIGEAIKVLYRKNPQSECNDIAREIAILQAKIDSLTELCPDAAKTQGDTLKYNDAVKNTQGLNGLWKSSTKLVATTDESPIELYMEFLNGKGTLTIKNKGINYTAPLITKIANRKITILQNRDATAPNVTGGFYKYKYVCNSDVKGNLSCTAINSNGSVVFNLLRIR